MSESMSVSAAISEQDLRDAARRWWILAVIGAVTAILGVIVIVRPVAGEFALALFIAAGFIISGIGDLVTAGRWPRTWVPVVWGLLSLAAGIVTIVWPGITLEVLAVVIGLMLLVRGVIAAMGALVDKPHGWGVWLVIGLVEVAAGVAAIAWPDVTILIVAIIIGIDLLIAGLAELAVAFQLRSLR
jgi:uncharacterized membrane protein HdeD (DUF308 family)